MAPKETFFSKRELRHTVQGPRKCKGQVNKEGEVWAQFALTKSTSRLIKEGQGAQSCRDFFQGAN